MLRTYCRIYDFLLLYIFPSSILFYFFFSFFERQKGQEIDPIFSTANKVWESVFGMCCVNKMLCVTSVSGRTMSGKQGQRLARSKTRTGPPLGFIRGKRLSEEQKRDRNQCIEKKAQSGI